jgi:hypothetical protein
MQAAKILFGHGPGGSILGGGIPSPLSPFDGRFESIVKTHAAVLPQRHPLRIDAPCAR